MEFSGADRQSSSCTSSNCVAVSSLLFSSLLFSSPLFSSLLFSALQALHWLADLRGPNPAPLGSWIGGGGVGLGAPSLVEAELREFGYLITKPKLEDDDKLTDPGLINANSAAAARVRAARADADADAAPGGRLPRSREAVTPPAPSRVGKKEDPPPQF